MLNKVYIHYKVVRLTESLVVPHNMAGYLWERRAQVVIVRSFVSFLSLVGHISGPWYSKFHETIAKVVTVKKGYIEGI